MSVGLRPFVPRFVLEWAEEFPEARYRSVNGTLVFTDLSGFTAMSERLSRLGKLGAEELTVHLDETFGELLDVAFARGGSLLKFGGDALLIFFWGDDHVRRGVAAAQEMRARLRQVGRRQTEAGTFRLRMSVGVHSGDFDFFLVGRSHRELVVTGPAATTTVEMESAADAGEILISRATAALLTPACAGEPKGDGVLLRRKPRVPPADRSGPTPPDMDPTAFVPTALRARLSDPHRDAEHRLVTVAFVHFVGVDSLLATEGPDETGRRIDELVTFVQNEFDREGITFLTTDIYDDGSKIFAQAGAPVSHENDEERMLRTLRKIADRDFGLGLRMGVNRGYIFAGEIGSELGRTYTAMGDAVNTAARVMAKAEVGQLLATKPVLDRSRTLFDATELAPFAAKGKSKPLIAHSVGRVIGVRTTEARGPFVGREEEVAVLDAALQQARSGQPAIVEISGAAGSGKSRLLSEFLQNAAGIPKFVVHGNQYESSTPYAALGSLVAQALDLPADDRDAWPKLLEERVRELRPDLADWLPLVALVLDVEVRSTTAVDELAPEFAGQRVATVVGDVLVAAVPDLRAIVIEDAHWIDHASASVIQGVLQTPDLPSWFVAIATRPGESRVRLPETAVTVEVGPLSAERSTDLLRRLAPGRFLPHEVEGLVARSGGNPLFLAELVQFDGTGLPDSVEDVFAARIDELHPEDARLLRYAAVLGQEVDIALLAAVTRDMSVESPARWDRLEPFVNVQFDEQYETIEFRHSLIRDSAYAGLSFRKRRLLHRDVATALESRALTPEAEAEALSLHFFEAGDWRNTWRYARVAAERARTRFAPIEAITYYDRAIEAGQKRHASPEEIAELREQLSTALLYVGRYEAAQATARNGRKRGISPIAHARLLFLEGESRRRSGDFAGAKRCYSRALTRAAHSNCAEWEARILTVLSATELLKGRHHAAVEYAARAQAAAVASSDPKMQAHADAALFSAHVAAGRVTTALQYKDLPLRVFQEEGALWQLSSFQTALGAAAQESGDWAAAGYWYAEAAATARRSGDIQREAAVENNRGEILSDQGRFDEADACFARAEILAEAARYRFGMAVVRANVGRLRTRKGDPARASEILLVGVEDLSALGAAHHAGYALAWLAEACALSGDTSEALAQLRQLEARTAPLPPDLHSQALRTAAICHTASGDTQRAVECLSASIAAAKDAASPYEEAIALETWLQLSGVLGNPPDGARERVHALFDRLGVVAVPPVTTPMTGGPAS